MRHQFAPRALLSTLLLMPSTITAVTMDCKNLLEDGVSFNFGDLKGPHSVYDVKQASVGITNTTYTIDICAPLKRPEGVNKKEFCDQGTQLCAIKQLIKDDESPIVEEVLEIAREDIHSGAKMAPKLTRLKSSASNEDSKREGLRVEIHGGKSKEDNKEQRAIIEFLCPEKEAKRYRRRDDSDDEKDGDKKDGDDKDKGGDDKDGDHSDEWAALRKSPDGHDGTLEFLSYDTDSTPRTLRMNWHTPYACEDFSGHDDSTPSGGWGFFSWFFFLLFIGVIAYFGFFAWVNYSKYGAQGWDLLPHSDTIRDVPYILADWGRKVVGTFTGGPGRGGYSAV